MTVTPKPERVEVYPLGNGHCMSVPPIQGGGGGGWGRRDTQDLRRRNEIIPINDSNTRIKPLVLASDHGRYITVTPERTLVSVGEWPLHTAVVNLYRFTSETLS
jgi:hypothetical protein